MITFTRVKGLSHKNVSEKGHGFPARMDRPSNSRAPDLFCVQVSTTLRGERVARNAKALRAEQKELKLFEGCEAGIAPGDEARADVGDPERDAAVHAFVGGEADDQIRDLIERGDALR